MYQDQTVFYFDTDEREIRKTTLGELAREHAETAPTDGGVASTVRIVEVKEEIEDENGEPTGDYTHGYRVDYWIVNGWEKHKFICETLAEAEEMVFEANLHDLYKAEERGEVQWNESELELHFSLTGLNLFLDGSMNPELLGEVTDRLELNGHNVVTGDLEFFNTLTKGGGRYFDNDPFGDEAKVGNEIVANALEDANDRVQWYELRRVTGSYPDGTYGAEHIEDYGNLAENDEPCSNPQTYCVQWDISDPDDEFYDYQDFYADDNGDIVVNGTVVATWVLA